MMKVVVITGASSGIGHEVAKLYNQKGYVLVLSGRNQDGFKDLSGKNIDLVLGDLTDQKVIEKLASVVEKKYGKIDVLINNAGITFIQPFEENTPEQLDLIINVNLKSHILLTSWLYPLMKKQRFGHIVFVNSSSGKEGYKNHTLYATTKFGLVGFAKSLRQETRQYNIKVTSVHPGGVKTNLYQNLKTPVDISAFMEPKPVAEAIVSLTESSGYCPDELILSRMTK